MVNLIKVLFSYTLLEKQNFMETPTRDVKTSSMKKSYKQSEGMDAPQWFNKLKGTLRK